jgi:hypothetical protein
MDHPTWCNGPDKQVPPKSESEGHARRAHSEGRACHARRSYQRRLYGRDKQVPPKSESEGHACRARRIAMDHPTWCNGPDKQVPPSGQDPETCLRTQADTKFRLSEKLGNTIPRAD